MHCRKETLVEGNISQACGETGLLLTDCNQCSARTSRWRYTAASLIRPSSQESRWKQTFSSLVCTISTLLTWLPWPLTAGYVCLFPCRVKARRYREGRGLITNTVLANKAQRQVCQHQRWSGSIGSNSYHTSMLNGMSHTYLKLTAYKLHAELHNLVLESLTDSCRWTPTWVHVHGSDRT